VQRPRRLLSPTLTRLPLAYIACNLPNCLTIAGHICAIFYLIFVENALPSLRSGHTVTGQPGNVSQGVAT